MNYQRSSLFFVYEYFSKLNEYSVSFEDNETLNIIHSDHAYLNFPVVVRRVIPTGDGVTFEVNIKNPVPNELTIPCSTYTSDHLVAVGCKTTDVNELLLAYIEEIVAVLPLE
jgi:hypothetical protein